MIVYSYCTMYCTYIFFFLGGGVTCVVLLYNKIMRSGSDYSRTRTRASRTLQWVSTQAFSRHRRLTSSVNCSNVGQSQGWEFAHWFFELIAHFLWAKEWFARAKEWITPVVLLSWAMGANHSRSLFWKERREQFAGGSSIVKCDESESLQSLFFKERLSDEWQEHWASGAIRSWA